MADIDCLNIMALVNVTNVQVRANPSSFTDPFDLLITFECSRKLVHPIEWKLIYVGCAHDQSYDQILDQFEIQNIEAGTMQFPLECPPPDYKKIPQDELLRVTAIILTTEYRGQEFFRVGYYVYNSLQQSEDSNQDPSSWISKVRRSILADKPRISRLEIDWSQLNSLESKSVTTDVADKDWDKGSVSNQKAAVEPAEHKTD